MTGPADDEGGEDSRPDPHAIRNRATATPTELAAIALLPQDLRTTDDLTGQSLGH